MALFKRIRRQIAGIQPEDEAPPAWRHGDRPGLREEAAAYIPASARGPEMQRFAARLSNEALEELDQVDEADEDEDDEDIEFLTSLANQIDTGTAAPRASRVSAATVREASRIELKEELTQDQALEIFREFSPTIERPPITELLNVKEVEIADLLEGLQTTAVALHQQLRARDETRPLRRAA